MRACAYQTTPSPAVLADFNSLRRPGGTFRVRRFKRMDPRNAAAEVRIRLEPSEDGAHPLSARGPAANGCAGLRAGGSLGSNKRGDGPVVVSTEGSPTSDPGCCIGGQRHDIDRLRSTTS